MPSFRGAPLGANPESRNLRTLWIVAGLDNDIAELG
jgi:hypothetical protein